MKHATGQDFEAVRSLFRQHRQWFPHIRNSHIKRSIEAGETIFDKGVVINYHIYKRKTKIGDVYAYPGDCILHQIAASERNGTARVVLNDFFELMSRRVFLSVRADNDIAIKFYHNMGMKHVGDTSWGKYDGLVFLKDHDPWTIT